MAALCAICIIIGLLIPFPVGGQLADWLNGSLAPATESTRYKEVSTFNMDGDLFRTRQDTYSSQYVWKNTSGYTNYNNVSHTAGTISVTEASTAGNNVTGNQSWAQMYPEFHIYFDYTAKDAYADNVAKISLYISNIYVASHPYARTITFSVGDVTLFTTTKSQTDTKNYIRENMTIDVNDLRQAIINKGDNAYFKLVLTAQDTTLSIANSGMFAYNVTKLTSRDDGLYIAGIIGCILVWAGIFLVQPKYNLPFPTKKSGKTGGF